MGYREYTNDALRERYQAVARIVAEPFRSPPGAVEEAEEELDAIAAEWTARGLNYRCDVGA